MKCVGSITDVLEFITMQDIPYQNQMNIGVIQYKKKLCSHTICIRLCVSMFVVMMKLFELGTSESSQGSNPQRYSAHPRVANRGSSLDGGLSVYYTESVTMHGP